MMNAAHNIAYSVISVFMQLPDIINDKNVDIKFSSHDTFLE